MSEKIYLDEQGVFVSSSRIKVGNKNLVLRNIASVSIEHIDWSSLLKIGMVGLFIALGSGIILAVLSILTLLDIVSHKNILLEILKYPAMTLPIWMLLVFLGSINYYFIKIETNRSGLFPVFVLFNKKPTLPRLAVEKINEALGALDTNTSLQSTETKKTQEKSKTDMTNVSQDLQKLKSMVEAGLISEEDYEQKKKQLLGL